MTKQNMDERGREQIFESFYETSTSAPLASPEAVSLSSRASVVTTAQSQVCNKTGSEHQPRSTAQFPTEQTSDTSQPMRATLVKNYCDPQTHYCPELDTDDNNVSSFYDISYQDVTDV